MKSTETDRADKINDLLFAYKVSPSTVGHFGRQSKSNYLAINPEAINTLEDNNTTHTRPINNRSHY